MAFTTIPNRTSGSYSLTDFNTQNRNDDILASGWITSSVVFGNIGVGVAPSATSAINTYRTATNAGWGDSILYINRRSISDVNGAYYPFGLFVAHYPKINTGVTDTGRCDGAYINVQRNVVASDAGTLSSIYGIEVVAGHANTYTEACTTTNVTCLIISPQAKSGTITNLYGLYIQTPASGGTITNEYGIFQQSATAENRFAGKINSILADGTAPYTSTSKTVCTNLNADLHDGCHIKFIDIGDWDMDATTSVAIAHGLTGSKIRTVEVAIRNDADNQTQSIDYPAAAGAYCNGGCYWTSANVYCVRTAGGEYDSVNYNATSFNRGYITIYYIP